MATVNKYLKTHSSSGSTFWGWCPGRLEATGDLGDGYQAEVCCCGHGTAEKQPVCVVAVLQIPPRAAPLFLGSGERFGLKDK